MGDHHVDGLDRAGPTALARWPALGLAVGPVAFVSAWAVGGARTPSYSPVNDAISRIAASGAPERGLMTAGFVVYGASVLVGSIAVRRSPLSRAWPLVAANALATWAVAALPLDVSDGMDLAHGVAATAGYVSLAAVPALAAGPLIGMGRSAAGRASVLAAGAIGVCLALTVVTEANGLAQRTGLGIGDVWLVAAGLALATGRVSGPTGPTGRAGRGRPRRGR